MVIKKSSKSESQKGLQTLHKPLFAPRFMVLVLPIALAGILFYSGFNQYQTVQRLKANCIPVTNTAAAGLSSTTITPASTLSTSSPDTPSTISSSEESDLVTNSFNPGEPSTTALQPDGGTSQTSSPNLQAVTTPSNIDPSKF